MSGDPLMDLPSIAPRPPRPRLRRPKKPFPAPSRARLPSAPGAVAPLVDAPQMPGSAVSSPVRLATPSVRPRRHRRDARQPAHRGLSLPFIGQPLQGVLRICHEAAEDGSIYVPTTVSARRRTAPTRCYSSAAWCRILKAGKWTSGKPSSRKTRFSKVPFRILRDGTDSRYLTGADFDRKRPAHRDPDR